MVKWDFGIQSALEEENLYVVYTPVETRKTYGVILVSEDEQQKKLQVHYEIDVICIDQEDERTHILELQKHQIYINEKKQDTTIDELVEKCGTVLYPLQVAVNQSGAVTRIVNQTSIQARWETQRKELVPYYRGTEAANFIQQMDRVVGDIDRLTALLLQRDWFMSLFFMPIYRNQKQLLCEFPQIPYAPSVPYDVKRRVTKHPQKAGDIVMKLSGNCVDSRSEKEILRGNLITISKEHQSVEGQCDLTYQIYDNSATIDMITGSCSLEFPSGKKKKMTVEIYNLKNKQPATSLEKQQALEEQKLAEPQPQKKKKRYFLFGKELTFRK